MYDIKESELFAVLFVYIDKEQMDMIRILQFVVLAFGVKELHNAWEYHKQKNKMGNHLSVYGYLCLWLFHRFIDRRFVNSQFDK